MALAAFFTATICAEDKFSVSVTPGFFSGVYNASQYRDQIQGNNIFLEGQIASQWGFSGSFEHSRIKYKLGLPDFTQNAAFLSTHLSHTPDHASGTYTVRLDLHSVSDNDGTYSGDDVRVIAPQISYLRLNNSVYLDLGYAQSRYGSGIASAKPLRVQQWTPTLSFALTPGAANWLKLRGYFIHSSNPMRSQDKTDTVALQAKYLYYPVSPYKLIPHHMEAAVLTGERIYAVDRDTASVANLAELEKGGISLSANWRLTNSVGLVLSAGRSKFRELTFIGYNNYTQNVAWLGLIMQW